MPRTVSPDQHSSLGISHALQTDHDQEQETLQKTILTDNMIKEAKDKDSWLLWARFVITLYYNKVAVNVLGCVTGWRWYDTIDDRIILGALPTPTQIKDMHQRGLVAVINMCMHFPGYEQLYEELGIHQIHLATFDFTVPSCSTLDTAVNALLQVMRLGPGHIYVHCKAGRGRSAAVVLGYLLRRYQLSPVEAQTILQTCRPQTDKHLHKADEIRMYYKDIIAGTESGSYTRTPYTKTPSV